jgi:ABC-type lipoprotein release transport system permease subunit
LSAEIEYRAKSAEGAIRYSRACERICRSHHRFLRPRRQYRKLYEMLYVYRGLLFIAVVVVVFSACVGLVKIMG